MPPVRAEVVGKLWPFGARLDDAANARHGAPAGLVSPPGALPVYVVATDEEHMIALDTERLIEGRKPAQTAPKHPETHG
jgi:acetate kinase